MEYKEGQRMIISKNAPHHKGEIGYFAFIVGRGKDCVVLSAEKNNPRTYFAVDISYVNPA